MDYGGRAHWPTLSRSLQAAAFLASPTELPPSYWKLLRTSRGPSSSSANMSTRAIIGRGLRETGAALKHASGLEVGVSRKKNCICNLKPHINPPRRTLVHSYMLSP